MKGFVSRIILLITLLGSVSPAFSEAIFRTESLPTDNATVGGQRLDLTKINAQLARHDASVLSIIPANGYKDGLAGVFRDYHLHIGNNGWIAYLEEAIPEKNLGKGYHLVIYVSRIRPSGQYSDLAGFRASWFKADGAAMFVPLNNPLNRWAQHLSDHDEWLRVGGPLDTMDRP
jgi:hypothetical protein